MAANSPFTWKVWMHQYDRYYDKKLGNMFINDFENFLSNNPGALWQAQALQTKFMQYNLGPEYWAKKTEMFRLTRINMGLKLANNKS
eukprot:gene7474-10187_t